MSDGHSVDDMGWQWGIRFNAIPKDVVLGRPYNEDGSLTQTVWLDSEKHAREALNSHAPLSAIEGTKRIVRRRVGPVEECDV